MAQRTCSEILAVNGEYSRKHRTCPQPVFAGGDKCYYHALVVERRRRDTERREEAEKRRHPPPSERTRSRRLS